MNLKFKKLIRKFHLSFDALLGRILYPKTSLEKLSQKPHKKIKSEDFCKFRYSRSNHFSLFRTLPVHEKQSTKNCDLKVYQDALVYTFILDNFSTGARLLEIGGGESRIITALKENYEIWNLDKLEGSGFGPKKLNQTTGFHLVQSYIGEFPQELPNSYFDLVFSISTVEHMPKTPKFINNAIENINLVLKPGGYSLHCIDALQFDDHYFVHPLVKQAADKNLLSSQIVTFEELHSDENFWALPPYAFYTRWFHLVKKPLKTFGHPFSINILWQKNKVLTHA
jgi:SAM-dependent methyltransferase